jgi:uridine kinase
MGHRPVFLGIAGGSGCGKTTVVGALVSGLAPAEVSIVHHDAYYRDYAHLPPRERARINFDHPDSLETSLLVEHLEALRQGNSVEVPTYDFATHTRRRRTESIHPTPVVIVDGILVLADPDLRSLMDIRIFIDTDPDLRFIRRLQRDVDERGRTHESVVDQYLATVRPMHLEFVEPSKRYADVIVPEGGFNRVAVEMIVARLQGILQTAPF